MAIISHHNGARMLEDGNNPEAVRIYTELVRLEPTNTDYLTNLGIALERTGDLKAARIAYERALEVDPGRVALAIALAGIQLNQGEAHEAIERLQPVVANNPEYTLARLTLAYTLCRSGDLEAGFQQYREAIRRDPDNLDALLAASSMLFQKRRLVEAEAIVRDAVRKYPTSFKAHMGLGATLARRGELLDAVRSYDAALSYARPLDDRQRSDLYAAIANAYIRLALRGKPHWRPWLRATLSCLRFGYRTLKAIWMS